MDKCTYLIANLEQALPDEHLQAFRVDGVALPMRFFDVSVKVLNRPPVKDLLALFAADEGYEVVFVEERVEPRVLSPFPQLQSAFESIAYLGGHDETLYLAQSQVVSSGGLLRADFL